MVDIQTFIRQQFLENRWTKNLDKSALSDEKLSCIEESFSLMDNKSKIGIIELFSTLESTPDSHLHRCIESVFLQALNEGDRLVKAVATIIHTKQHLNYLNFNISPTNAVFRKHIDILLSSKHNWDPVKNPLLFEYRGRSDRLILSPKPDKPAFTNRDKDYGSLLKETFLDKLKEECQRTRINVPIPGRRKIQHSDDSSNVSSTTNQLESSKHDSTTRNNQLNSDSPHNAALKHHNRLQAATVNSDDLEKSRLGVKAGTRRKLLCDDARASAILLAAKRRLLNRNTERKTNDDDIESNPISPSTEEPLCDLTESPKSQISRSALLAKRMAEHHQSVLNTTSANLSNTQQAKRSKTIPSDTPESDPVPHPPSATTPRIKLLDFDDLPAHGLKAKQIRKEQLEKERELKRQLKENRLAKQRQDREQAKAARQAELSALRESRRAAQLEAVRRNNCQVLPSRCLDPSSNDIVCTASLPMFAQHPGQQQLIQQQHIDEDEQGSHRSIGFIPTPVGNLPNQYGIGSGKLSFSNYPTTYHHQIPSDFTAYHPIVPQTVAMTTTNNTAALLPQHQHQPTMMTGCDQQTTINRSFNHQSLDEEEIDDLDELDTFRRRQQSLINQIDELVETPSSSTSAVCRSSSKVVQVSHQVVDSSSQQRASNYQHQPLLIDGSQPRLLPMPGGGVGQTQTSAPVQLLLTSPLNSDGTWLAPGGQQPLRIVSLPPSAAPAPRMQPQVDIDSSTTITTPTSSTNTVAVSGSPRIRLLACPPGSNGTFGSPTLTPLVAPRLVPIVPNQPLLMTLGGAGGRQQIAVNSSRLATSPGLQPVKIVGPMLGQSQRHPIRLLTGQQQLSTTPSTNAPSIASANPTGYRLISSAAASARLIPLAPAGSSTTTIMRRPIAVAGSQPNVIRLVSPASGGLVHPLAVSVSQPLVSHVASTPVVMSPLGGGVAQRTAAHQQQPPTSTPIN